jgi:hypothetical protein
VAYGHLEYEPINPKGALEVVGTGTMKGRESTCKYSYNGGALTAKQH